jgi:hypothetical protein
VDVEKEVVMRVVEMRFKLWGYRAGLGGSRAIERHESMFDMVVVKDVKIVCIGLKSLRN